MALHLLNYWEKDPNLGNSSGRICCVFTTGHLVSWLIHLMLLLAVWRVFLEYQPRGDITILYGILSGLIYLIAAWIWFSSVYAWLDGARKFVVLRYLLFFTALANSGLMIMTLPLNMRLLAGGIVSLWVGPNPFALFSLSVFVAKSCMSFVVLVVQILHACLCGLLAWKLVWRVPVPSNIKFSLSERKAPVVAQMSPTRFICTELLSRWHSERPVKLSSPQRNGSTVLSNYIFIPLRAYAKDSSSMSSALNRIKECRNKFEWPDFEWVFRTRPSWEEERYALLAIPNLAAVVDQADANSIRNVLVSYSEDTREFDVLPSRQEDDYPDARLQRVAHFGRETLKLWDEERANPTATE